ncbi:uroporphyrinogen decarboxylase [Actinobacteria bacterium YIM 96077]|uniref:Uroporphyrinogen decarboxylase n=1 Tax=Phytoactinopolyspora halophila TaxID=1981511 RepID=A0A329QZP9_9ACTN|nr:uroporphyrinogen decarboxylase [Phytoactinopolyspora halophila]AYY13409.1 uroporphyrinogen decarboxylase [Actinobacteria bacterium YIM 96077]RAW17356.1 uroporphyrinogen decarboxylase [Phytoactinopolyspora halophila]
MKNSLLVRTCRGIRSGRPPVWFMRQAGRSLPEYRQVREGMSMLESCQRPDMVVEITMQPVRRYGVDGAIFFSDIVVPLKAIGLDIEIEPGVGPVVAEPIRRPADLERLRPLEPDDVSFATEAVRGLLGELGETPLIGFAGAPFTLASYLVEGGPSRHHERTKALMHSQPDLWHDLLARVAQMSATYLQVQVAAGASVVQLFDSWAGALSRADYERFVLPHSTTVLQSVRDVPRIHFGVGTSEFLDLMAGAGADVVGVDWRLALDEAARRVPGTVLQGNLDPALLLADWPVIEAEIERIVTEGRAAPGHVFNLGHGVLPSTDPDVLAAVVEHIHTLSTR